MKKTLISAVLAGLALSACGGGDDSSTPAASGPAIRLAYSGAPLVATQRARAMAAVADGASGASSPGASAGDVQPTVAALQDAFKARGADIAVYPGVVNGSKLHDIVMSENGGVGPTTAEIANSKTNISEWALVYFELDDMSGYVDSAQRRGEVDQFKRDLQVYGAREYLKGRVIFAARPVVSCAGPKEVRTIDDNGLVVLNTYKPTSQVLYEVIEGSGIDGLVSPIGGIYKPDVSHMGADCSTPDQTVRDAHLASIADPLVDRYKVALDTINKCKYNPSAIPEGDRSAQCWGIEPVKK
ncbi:hypothetical protein JM78_25030 [Burkholderia pyrrocinia]|uniref:hypothetical protein n=1 Tax=Burkholderia pyrrocinia TaxID=60550 RepID=UPI000506AB89|nr:hypothetical protein [Burkholderia pyrrocinia]KFL51677.1 hypothetical protein JM78_25030 [Burkholderia pyrrocinia]